MALDLAVPAASDSPSAAAPRPALTKVYVCRSGTASLDGWRKTAARAVAEALSPVVGAKVRVMGDADCGKQEVEVACGAGVYDRGGRVLVCSPDTLLLLVRASAWYAVGRDGHDGEDYEAFRARQPPKLGLAAFTAARAADADAAVELRIDALRAGSEAADGVLPTGRNAAVFHAILAFVFAALFGHEGSHLETTPPYCAAPVQARVEEAGLWAALRRVSGSGELYASQAPVAGEVAADRCGARRVRAARAALERGGMPVVDQAFATRAAADIVSTMLLIGVGRGGTGDSVSINDTYLYPPLRIIALAGEMNVGGPGPTVCGGAAENLVQAAQLAYRLRPGKGLMPDEIEGVFPKAAIDAWEGRAPWSPASFACR